MDATILCTLLAQRIPPEKFQLWGRDVRWMDEQFNTPENSAIVADVTAKYDTLAAAYLAEQQAAEQAQAATQAAKAQAFLDNLPSWPLISDAVDKIASLADAKIFIKKLARVVYWIAKDQAD